MTPGRYSAEGIVSAALLALMMRRSLVLPNEKAIRPVSLHKVFNAGLGRRMGLAWVLAVLKLGTYWTCYTWLPSFLLKEMGQSIGKSMSWILTAQVGQFVGMLTFGTLADKWGRRPAYSVYSVLTAGALATLAFGWSWLNVHLGWFWLTMLLLGFGSGCTAGFGALLAELFPTGVRATAQGLCYNAGRALSALAPFTLGVVADRRGIGVALALTAGFYILGAALMLLLPETRAREVQG